MIGVYGTCLSFFLSKALDSFVFCFFLFFFFVINLDWDLILELLRFSSCFYLSVMLSITNDKLIIIIIKIND